MINCVKWLLQINEYPLSIMRPDSKPEAILLLKYEPHGIIMGSYPPPPALILGPPLDTKAPGPP